ncbi:MFS transporter [Aspergillus stella-maris]|uniref:MFS transporter n=1 Tax=Aspergillus stella-maris TaxID=1810926 RepID=UPI003CCDA68B
MPPKTPPSPYLINIHNKEAMSAKTIAYIGPRLKHRIVTLLCLLTFTTVLGSTLQREPLIHLREETTCKEVSELRRQPGPTRTGYDFCQSAMVHDKVTLVYRVYKAIPVIVAMVCAIPFGVHTSRNPACRKTVLVLSGVEAALALGWVLAVCYFRAVSTWWIWLSGIFLLLGGGDTVALSIVHAMVADVVGEEERSKTFLYFQAAEVIAGLLGPRLGLLIMSSGGGIWSVLFFAVGAIIARIEIARSLPERIAHDNESRGFRVRRPIFRLLAPPRQAIPLLLIYVVQDASKDVFAIIGLRYSAVKFSLPFGSASRLLTLFQASQTLCVVIVLPMVMYLVSAFLPWNSWVRDRNFMISLIALLALGTLIMGLTPSPNVETVGLVLVALGRCLGPFILSLLSGAVRPEQIGVVYSVAIMGGMVGSHAAEPIFHALLVCGMKLEGGWIGLPFDVMAGGMAVVLLATLFVKRGVGNEL